MLEKLYGTFSLSDFDETNPIAMSAGITDFNFNISGSGVSYSAIKLILVTAGEEAFLLKDFYMVVIVLTKVVAG